MSASLPLLRLMWGVEILGLFLLSFLVRRPFVLKPCVEGLGRPFVGREVRGETKRSVTSARYKPNPWRKKHGREGGEGRLGRSHGDALRQGYPVLKRGMIVLLVELIEGGQLIG